MTAHVEPEKVLDRVRKLVTLAGRTSNEHERKLAARKAVEYLDAHPAPLRWKVPTGTHVRVIDARYYKDGTATDATKLRKTHARSDNWFFEAHRVTGAESARALALGYLLFKRHNMAVFVDAGKVEVHL